jgi:hypothetical protein
MRPKARAIAAASCAVVLGAATAATATAGSSITLAAFAKRANAVCVDYHRRTAKLPHPQLGDFSGVVKLARAALVIVGVENRKLRAIPLPSTKRTLAEKWLSRGYRVPKLLRDLEHAGELKSLTRALAANQALQANGAERRVLARRLGMRACARSS